MDINNVTITVGSIFLIIGILMTVFSFMKANKRDIQIKSADYTTVKNTTVSQQKEIQILKEDVKDLEKEVRIKFSKLESKLFEEIKGASNKIDELKTLIITNRP